MIAPTALETGPRYFYQKGSRAMIDKCANPQCNERLVYLRSGVLYAVDTLSASNPQPATHFFWLCEPCSIKFTLHFDGRSDPSVVPVRIHNLPYASESVHSRVQCIFMNRQWRQTTDENDRVGNEHEGAGRITPATHKMPERIRTPLPFDARCRSCA